MLWTIELLNYQIFLLIIIETISGKTIYWEYFPFVPWIFNSVRRINMGCCPLIIKFHKKIFILLDLTGNILL